MQVNNRLKKMTVCPEHAKNTLFATNDEVLSLCTASLRRPLPNKGKLKQNTTTSVRQLIDSGKQTPLCAVDSMTVRHRYHGFAVVEAALPMTSAIAVGQEKVDNRRVFLLLKLIVPAVKSVKSQTRGAAKNTAAKAMKSVTVDQSRPIRPVAKAKRFPTGPYERVLAAAVARARPRAVLDRLYQTAVGTMCLDSADGRVQLTGGWYFVNSGLTRVCKRCRALKSRDVGFAHTIKQDLDVLATYDKECDRQNIDTQLPLPDEQSCALTKFLASDAAQTTRKVWNPKRRQQERMWSEAPVTELTDERNKEHHVTPQPGHMSAEESSDAEVSMEEDSVDDETRMDDEEGDE
jgi:hypothetical protein